MQTYLERLLANASEPLRQPPEARPAFLAGDRGNELWSLLQTHNGFYAFENSLHLFPSGAHTLEQWNSLHLFPSGGQDAHTLERWNAQTLWISHYRDLTDGCIFFAEDVFGGQFAIKCDEVHSFDPETGETEWVAADIEGWARAILDDYEVLTGYPLARAWQVKYGALAAGHRLIPKTPFVAGGAFELANLYAADAVQGMRFRADLAHQIRGVADGSQIRIDVMK